MQGRSELEVHDGGGGGWWWLVAVARFPRGAQGTVTVSIGVVGLNRDVDCV